MRAAVWKLRSVTGRWAERVAGDWTKGREETRKHRRGHRERGTHRESVNKIKACPPESAFHEYSSWVCPDWCIGERVPLTLERNNSSNPQSSFKATVGDYDAELWMASATAIP